MGEDASLRKSETATLHRALELGVKLIDTAEMYAEGGAESLIGEAIAGHREDVFLVSKVYPHNATSDGTPRALERTLKRLRTEWLDLYLLHWRGDVPLAETMEAFLKLQQSGKIKYFGVSNFDISDMRELWKVSEGREAATNQLLYNLTRRGIEYDLLPWLRERHIPVMAYSPIEQGRLLEHSGIRALAKKSGITPAQLALAWLLSFKDIVVIPKTSSPKRLEEDYAARQIKLSREQLEAMDELFPPPSAPQALEML